MLLKPSNVDLRLGILVKIDVKIFDPNHTVKQLEEKMLGMGILTDAKVSPNYNQPNIMVALDYDLKAYNFNVDLHIFKVLTLRSFKCKSCCVVRLGFV